MLSTECRRYIHVLFDGVSYEVRSAHSCVNNKTKKKINSFSVNTIKKIHIV